MKKIAIVLTMLVAGSALFAAEEIKDPYEFTWAQYECYCEVVGIEASYSKYEALGSDYEELCQVVRNYNASVVNPGCYAHCYGDSPEEIAKLFN